MLIVAVTLAWIVGLLVLAAVMQQFAARRQIQRRVFEERSDDVARSDEHGVLTGRLDSWLARAGYRGPAAVFQFAMVSLAALVAGGMIGYLSWATGLLGQLDQGISAIPGGMSNLLRPVLYAIPYLLAVIFAAIPLLVVRRTRRRRVSQVEQDLPTTLELLATLAEAGLGFDAALDRILASQLSDRPLTQEFRNFQVEVLGGRPRVEALRRFARRLDVTAVTIFSSALVQAEQIGSGIAEVLRSQADDLRQRRRERAVEVSMALPVKLLFPLVICFLPGILLFTLGPAFYEFFKLADAYSLSRHF